MMNRRTLLDHGGNRTPWPPENIAFDLALLATQLRASLQSHQEENPEAQIASGRYLCVGKPYAASPIFRGGNEEPEAVEFVRLSQSFNARPKY